MANTSSERLSAWFDTPQGARLLREERAYLGEAARRFHGDTLLWAGCHGEVSRTVRGCMIRHRLFASPVPQPVVEDLSSQGIEDYFIGRQNFISLGVFSDRATAERRREEIEQYGYQPQVEQRFRTTSQYWLDLEAPEPDLPTEAQWNDWLEQHPDASPQPKPCQ